MPGPAILIICLLTGIGTAEIVLYVLEQIFAIPEALPEPRRLDRAA